MLCCFEFRIKQQGIFSCARLVLPRRKNRFVSRKKVQSTTFLHFSLMFLASFQFPAIRRPTNPFRRTARDYIFQ